MHGEDRIERRPFFRLGICGFGSRRFGALECGGSDPGAVPQGSTAGLDKVSAYSCWQNPAAAADWTWTSNGREITLTSYSGPNAVVIPDMLDGLPVTGFGGIFGGNPDITSVGGGAKQCAPAAQTFLSGPCAQRQ